MEILSTSPGQTKKQGERVAKKILSAPLGKRAFVLGLAGNLGSGKTTFLQGFAKGLGIKEKITSPTFVIIRKYEARSTKKRRNLQNFILHPSYFCHIDCYRLEKPKEILSLGFEEIISEPQNIVAIEWAEKIKKILPKNTLWLEFKFIDKNKRKVVLNESI